MDRSATIWWMVLLGVFVLWIAITFWIARPALNDWVNDFETRVIVLPEGVPEKARQKAVDKINKKAPGATAPVPTRKDAPSKQTIANTRKANALKQCSNVTIGCMADLERIARDSAARQSVSKNK